MASTATQLRISDLPKRQASALKRKAQRMGISAGDYIKQLIEDDLALDQKAYISALAELAAPFTKALKGAGEEEIAQIVSGSLAAPVLRLRCRWSGGLWPALEMLKNV